MASGNREAPAFPVHAGFAILPRLIAETVINTVQAASDTVTEPHCEEGKEILSNLRAWAGGTESAGGRDRYEHRIRSPLLSSWCPTYQDGYSRPCQPEENSKAVFLLIFFFNNRFSIILLSSLQSNAFPASLKPLGQHYSIILALVK